MGQYSRRAFLTRLVAGTAALTAASLVDLEGFEQDPERLLWVPGQKTFFLPPLESMRSGDEALEDFATIQKRSLKDVLTGPTRHVQTRRGVLTFDAAWNIIGLNGRRLTAAEATQLRQESFAPWGGRWKDPNVSVTEADLVAARAEAGEKYPRQHGKTFHVDPRTVSHAIPSDAPFRIVGDEKPPWNPGEEPWTARGRRKAGALKPHEPRAGSRVFKLYDE
jgi:hypothetical protein